MHRNSGATCVMTRSSIPLAVARKPNWQSTPGTPEHANIIFCQLSIATNALSSAFTARGDSGYANREDELRKHKGYEEEIEENNSGIRY